MLLVKTDNKIFHYGGGINQIGTNYLFSSNFGKSSFGFEVGGGIGILATIPKFHGDVENYSMLTQTAKVFDQYKLAGYSISGVTGIKITILKSDRIRTEIYLRTQLHYFDLIDFEYQNDLTNEKDVMYGFKNIGIGFILGDKTSVSFNLNKKK